MPTGVLPTMQIRLPKQMSRYSVSAKSDDAAGVHQNFEGKPERANSIPNIFAMPVSPQHFLDNNLINLNLAQENLTRQSPEINHHSWQ